MCDCGLGVVWRWLWLLLRDVDAPVGAVKPGDWCARAIT